MLVPVTTYWHPTCPETHPATTLGAMTCEPAPHRAATFPALIETSEIRATRPKLESPSYGRSGSFAVAAAPQFSHNITPDEAHFGPPARPPLTTLGSGLIIHRHWSCVGPSANPQNFGHTHKTAAPSRPPGESTSPSLASAGCARDARGMPVVGVGYRVCLRRFLWKLYVCLHPYPKCQPHLPFSALAQCRNGGMDGPSLIR